MEIIPRKDDVIVLHSKDGPFAVPKEYHTVWIVYIYVDRGISKVTSVGYRCIL